MRIEGRTFIISGGSSGLGLATTNHLLSHGGSVSIFDLNPPPTTLSNTLFTKTDVTSSPSIASALSATLEWTRSTSRPLSGLICCAGIARSERVFPKQADPTTTPTLMSMSTFDLVLSINLRGTVDLIRQTLPHLAAASPPPTATEADPNPDIERGVIVVVSSSAAFEGQVGQLAYSASKGAVASLVLPLAREIGPSAGIRAVGIAPGLFQTSMSMPGSKESDEVPEMVTERLRRTGMVQYPARMGKGAEFARLVGEIIGNPMLNGTVIRLDGAVRLPSRM